MGLPFSGNGTPIDFSDIQTTFGGANPISMSEYYRGGAYVTNNNTGVPTNLFTITSASWSASVAIIGISGSTVIPVGTSVVIAGMTPSGYNGTYTVTVSSAGTFRYALATDPNIANVFTITSASWLASVVTIVISGATVITVGTSVIVAGMTPAGYNGTYTVTVSSAGTFRYALATNPGVATVFGTATRATVFGTATTAIGTFPIAVGNFYGASKQFSLAIAANTANLSVTSAYLTTAGWDGASYFQLTVNSGIYVYSTSTASGGMDITGSYPYGFGIVNGGYILGMGGAGGFATSGSTTNLTGKVGGPALTVTNSFTTATMSILNNTGAYIAGGGGGGAGMRNSGGEIWGGGGGGAGGGSGGQAFQSRGGYTLGSPGAGGAVGVAGGNGSGDGASGGGGGGAGGGGGGYVLDGISSIRNGGGSGGGGGRILPGTGGANGDSAADGGAGNAVGGSISSGGDNVGAAGGGGWGAAGGNFSSSQGTVSGGAGGAAIDKNNSTVTVTNSGTLYGSTLA